MVQGRILYQYVCVLCIYQTFYNNAACCGFVNSIGLSLRSMRQYRKVLPLSLCGQNSFECITLIA